MGIGACNQHSSTGQAGTWRWWPSSGSRAVATACGKAKPRADGPGANCSSSQAALAPSRWHSTWLGRQGSGSGCWRHQRSKRRWAGGSSRSASTASRSWSALRLPFSSASSHGSGSSSGWLRSCCNQPQRCGEPLDGSWAGSRWGWADLKAALRAQEPTGSRRRAPNCSSSSCSSTSARSLRGTPVSCSSASLGSAPMEPPRKILAASTI